MSIRSYFRYFSKSLADEYILFCFIWSLSKHQCCRKLRAKLTKFFVFKNIFEVPQYAVHIII
jgi:hypothetical protein